MGKRAAAVRARISAPVAGAAVGVLVLVGGAAAAATAAGGDVPAPEPTQQVQVEEAAEQPAAPITAPADQVPAFAAVPEEPPAQDDTVVATPPPASTPAPVRIPPPAPETATVDDVVTVQPSAEDVPDAVMPDVPGAVPPPEPPPVRDPALDAEGWTGPEGLAGAQG